jgi:hypothetical protein
MCAAASLVCADNDGELNVKWTASGQRARCLADNGNVIAGPENCNGGHFVVERIASPAALEAVCTT